MQLCTAARRKSVGRRKIPAPCQTERRDAPTVNAMPSISTSAPFGSRATSSDAARGRFRPQRMSHRPRSWPRNRPCSSKRPSFNVSEAASARPEHGLHVFQRLASVHDAVPANAPWLGRWGAGRTMMMMPRTPRGPTPGPLRKLMISFIKPLLFLLARRFLNRALDPSIAYRHRKSKKARTAAAVRGSCFTEGSL